MNYDLFRRLQEYHLTYFHIMKCKTDDCKECEDIQDYYIKKEEVKT